MDTPSGNPAQNPTCLREQLQGLQRTLRDHASRFDQVALEQIADAQEKFTYLERAYQETDAANGDLKRTLEQLTAEVAERERTISDLNNQLAMRATQVTKVGGDAEKLQA